MAFIMNEKLHNTPSEWLTFMLDGELDKTKEAELYSQLGNDPILQNEMNDLITISKTVKNDTEAFTPPVVATKNIFNSLGINSHLVNSVSSNLGSTLIGFFTKFWKPITAGVAATLFTMFFIYNNDEYPKFTSNQDKIDEITPVKGNKDFNDENLSNPKILAQEKILNLNKDSKNNIRNNINVITNPKSHNNLSKSINIFVNENLDKQTNKTTSPDGVLKNINAKKELVDLTISENNSKPYKFVSSYNSSVWQKQIKEKSNTKISSPLNFTLLLNRRNSEAQSDYSVGGEWNSYLAKDFSITGGIEVVNNPMSKASANVTSINPAGYLNLGLEYNIYNFKPYFKNGIARFESYWLYKFETGISYNIYNKIDINASFDVNMFITSPDNLNNYINNPKAFSFGLKYGL